MHDTYDDARAGGATLAEAAERLKLKAVTIDAIDQGAKRPDDSLVSDLPESSELLRAAFASEVGVENEAVNIGTDGFVFFEVQGITPTRERPLAEVKDKVIADWTKAEAEKRMTDKIAEFEKRLKDGATLDTIATEASLEKQTKRGIKRGAEDADFGADGVAEVFGVAEGGIGDFKSPGERRPHLVQGRRSVRTGGLGRRCKSPKTLAEATLPALPTTCSTNWSQNCSRNMTCASIRPPPRARWLIDQ